MTALPQPLAARLGKLVGLLGSTHDGEVTAAGRAIERALKGAGLDLHDLAEHVAAPPPTPQVIYRDRTAERPTAPRSYGDWRSAWRRPPGTSERDRVVRCRRVGGYVLTVWERTFLDSLVARLDTSLCLTPRQIASLAQIEVKLGVRV